jgi:hypothetical protein
MLNLPKRIFHAPDTIQPQFDTGLPLRVQTFEVLQPVF